jgi:hypothetical protein
MSQKITVVKKGQNAVGHWLLLSRLKKSAFGEYRQTCILNLAEECPLNEGDFVEEEIEGAVWKTGK